MGDRNNSVYGKGTWEITHRITITSNLSSVFQLTTSIVIFPSSVHEEVEINLIKNHWYHS